MTDRPEDAATARTVLARALARYERNADDAGGSDFTRADAQLVALSEQGYSVKRLEQVGHLAEEDEWIAIPAPGKTILWWLATDKPTPRSVPVFREV